MLSMPGNLCCVSYLAIAMEDLVASWMILLVTSFRLSGAGLLPDCPSLLPVCFPTSLPGLGNVLGNATKGSWYAQNTGRYVSELFGQVKYSALKK